MSFVRLQPDAYQSFVGNWTPDSAPLCAAIRSQAEWDQVLHPAAVMGASKPFSPDPGFWRGHMVLLIARVAPAAAEDAFTAPAVSRAGGALTVSYHFTVPPPASSTMKWYLALAVTKASPTAVSFQENGRRVCALRLAAGKWRSP